MTITDTLDLTSVPFTLWDSLTAQQEEPPTFAWQELHDSLFAPRAQADSVVVRSMFTGQSLPVEHPSLLPRATTHPAAWIFVVLIAATVLLTFFCREHKVTTKTLLPALVSTRGLDRLLATSDLTRPLKLFSVAALLCIALALLAQHLLWPEEGLTQWALLSIGLCGAYGLRNGLCRLLGTIFEAPSSVSTYLSNAYLYQLLLLAVLLPALLLFFYLPHAQGTMTWICGGLIVAEWIGRMLRGTRIFFAHPGGAYVHLFYYLCTVELIPILVLINQIID